MNALMSTWTLSLLRLTSPALPVGGFAYSRGLEQAVHAGWVHDAATAQTWISGLLTHVVSAVDAPLFVRLYAAHEQADLSNVQRWNDTLCASRESQELRLEDTLMGTALARLLVSLDVSDAADFMHRGDTSFASMFALASSHFKIPLDAALLGFLWLMAESQTSCAVRLIPLGQTAGQRILSHLITRIPEAAEQALVLTDDAIGNVAPGLAIASALHETQYCRLFRS